MIGKYVQDVIAFPTGALASPSEHKKGKSKDTGRPSWASRQIAVAYEEHASVIESLQEELNTVKTRERALVKEFSERFRLMHKQGNIISSNSTATLNSGSISFGKDDDMPMDEMADCAKMERNARNLEKLEQKIFMQKFKEEAYKEMTKVQEQYANQIKAIEISLEEKVSEVEKLRKQSERMRLERNFYKKQQEEKVAHNPVQPTIHPNGSPTESNPNSLNLVSPTEGSEMAIDPSTPIGRIRTLTPSSTSSIVTDTPDTLSPRELVSLSFANDESNSSCPVSPTALSATKFHQHPDFLEKLVNAIELVVVQKNKENLESLEQLTVAERHFVEHVEGLISSSQKKQEKDVECLLQNLRDANNEIQGGATLAESLEKDLEQRERQIHDLEEQLEMANQSIKTTADLEKMLQMVADDQKDAEKEQEDLMNRIREVEEQRDSLLDLLEGKLDSDEMHQDSSMRTIQKAVADVKSRSDNTIQVLTAKINELEEENSILQTQLDISIDASDDSSIDGHQTKRMSNDSLEEKLEKIETLEQELSKLRSKMEDVNIDNEQLRKKNKSYEEQLKAANQILQTTKGVHAREQKLEDELCELRALLDTTIKAKTRIQAKVDFMVANNKKKQLSINKLNNQVSELQNRLSEVNSEQGKMSNQDHTELTEAISERDQELNVLNSEIVHIKEQLSTNMNALKARDNEIRMLKDSIRESITEASTGYISGDESDTDDDATPLSSLPLPPPPPPPPKVSERVMSKEISDLQEAKEKAEQDAKRHAENLANAKLIISSLEQSNKTMTSDLRSRLQDSNAAIVSLLDQSNKHEQESSALKAKIEQILRSKAEVEQELQTYKTKETELSKGHE